IFLDIMNPLQSTRAELEKLLRERAKLDRKIDAVRQAIKAFEPVYGDLPPINMRQLRKEIRDMGMTAAIEQLLKAHYGTPLTPTTVRDLLVESGFKLVGDNPLASIHQVLKRLVARGE